MKVENDYYPEFHTRLSNKANKFAIVETNSISSKDPSGAMETTCDFMDCETHIIMYMYVANVVE